MKAVIIRTRFGLRREGNLQRKSPKNARPQIAWRWRARVARRGPPERALHRAFTSHIYGSLVGHSAVFYDIHKSCRERFTRNIFRLMLIAPRFIVLMLLLTALSTALLLTPANAVNVYVD